MQKGASLLSCICPGWKCAIKCNAYWKECQIERVNSQFSFLFLHGFRRQLSNQNVAGSALVLMFAEIFSIIFQKALRNPKGTNGVENNWKFLKEKNRRTNCCGARPMCKAEAHARYYRLQSSFNWNDFAFLTPKTKRISSTEEGSRKGRWWRIEKIEGYWS